MRVLRPTLRPHSLATRKPSLLQIKIFGAAPIPPEQGTRVALPMHQTGGVTGRLPRFPIVPQDCWSFPPLIPQVQVTWPWPAYFGHPGPMWSNPSFSSPSSFHDLELSDSDSSLDSASEELQDPHLDSLALAQSTSTSGTIVPAPTTAMVISHTTVEVHSLSEPTVDPAHTSLPSSSTGGVSSPLPNVEDDRVNLLLLLSQSASV